MLAAGRLAEYSDVNLAALERGGGVPHPRGAGQGRADAPRRRLPLRQRLACLRRIGLYRQTRGGTLTL